ncbi:Hypothetical_protein [Hexamita inflata]|uniref:Hypothetical_protein n=1 Tax=Hexamita inflata TaxID=28002 RepID=A0AA86Q4I0_9EUKA|nr:Hypothetical protein HINF_LOCUS33114 [Hexamita inflata]
MSIAEIPAMLRCDDGFIRLRFSFLAASHFQTPRIGRGRYNFPVQSAELLSRIGVANGMPSGLESGNRSMLPQKRRQYDAGGFPYRSACTKQPHYAPGCLYPSRWLPWLRRCAQRTQVCLKLMIIRVNSSCTEDRTSINESQVSGIYIILLKTIYNINQQPTQKILLIGLLHITSVCHQISCYFQDPSVIRTKISQNVQLSQQHQNITIVIALLFIFPIVCHTCAVMTKFQLF